MDFTSTETEFAGQQFKNLALAGARVEARVFEGCTFVRCTFREAALESCRFVDCTFRKCDLTFAHVKDCTFANTFFEDCQIVGVDWTEAAWTKSLLRQGVGFTGCALNHSSFAGLKLHAFKATNCVARDLDFSDCDLTRADLTGTDFSETRFWHTNLTEADFTGATNYAIAPTANTLKKAKFSLPEALSLLRALDILLVE